MLLLHPESKIRLFPFIAIFYSCGEIGYCPQPSYVMSSLFDFLRSMTVGPFVCGKLLCSTIVGELSLLFRQFEEFAPLFETMAVFFLSRKGVGFFRFFFSRCWCLGEILVEVCCID